MEGGTGPETEAFSPPICSVAATCMTPFPAEVSVEQAGAHAAHSRSLVHEGPCVLCTQGLKRKNKIRLSKQSICQNSVFQSVPDAR